ncbi:CsgG/HfaB family protein [Myxococcota bacterium]|nr:CsgG/HfaB family protein [Myxococcota bacterium]
MRFCWRITSFTVLAALGFATAATTANGAPVRVALLPVAVHTSEADNEYLSRGISDMLSARIERSGEVVVTRAPEGGAATTRIDQAMKAARSLGAQFVVFGSFTQFGAGASLDIHCLPVPDREEADERVARRIFIQTGTLEEIIPKLDELSAKLTRYLASPDALEQVGTEAPVPGVAGSPQSDFEGRIEALERVVFGVESGPESPPEATP